MRRFDTNHRCRFFLARVTPTRPHDGRTAQSLGFVLVVRSAVALVGLVAAPANEHDDVALTARERQVVELIAEGLSNKQIGARLFISAKTASVHVSAILRKLGVATRADALARAREYGLR